MNASDMATQNQISDIEEQTWIGLHDLKHNGQWSWTDCTAVDYLNWAPGQPNILNNGQYCVNLYSDNELDFPTVKYQWNDWYCDSSMRAFVCKRPATWS